MFCGEMKVDLRAHFLSVHQEEEKIKELSTLGKRNAFRQSLLFAGRESCKRTRRLWLQVAIRETL